MMGNLLMINQETGDELNPYHLSKDVKTKLYDERTTFACKCCYPEKKLLYHFTETLQFRAIHNIYTKMHEESCVKNEEYQKRISYANPLQQDEDGKLVARVYEDLFKRPNRTTAEAGTEHKKRRDKKHTEQHRMRLSALVKKINLEVSYRQACRYSLRKGDEDNRKIQFKLEKEFSEEVYGHAQQVMISNRKGTVAGCNLDKDGVQFFYNRISRIRIRKYIEKQPIDNSYTTLSCDELIKQKNEHNGKLYCSLEYNGRFIDITYDALRIALQQYENTYNNKSVDLEKDIIIGAGYQYENGKTYLLKESNTKRKCGEIDRFTLLLVNKYGVFCESTYEVKCFDEIMDYIMNNHLYEKIKFYKPYAFTKNAYGDAEWLEDGVIRVKGCKKIGIVEVFGMMASDEYREKTRLKIEYAKENEDKFVFLTWYPQTESEEILRRKLISCIEDIEKSEY